MAFDQPTRNRLQRFVSDARALLTEEFTRQLQNEFGLDPVSGDVSDLSKLARRDDAHRETALLLRDTLEHYLANTPSGKRKDCLDRIVREQAFTVLNRLCALRMAEARVLIIEAVGNGYQSKAFQLYSRLAGTALGETGDAYQAFLFSVFDEFAVDLPVLFDRFSPQGKLFPRESALLRLLELVNHADLAPLWSEDETIGWVYQYFNSKEERKKMRDESAAPRNSRELAVRNQFFTPRYVVEFLTDNTLGRIWYEMTQGQTALKVSCRYLVRRPNEVFLKEGEAPGSDNSNQPQGASPGSDVQPEQKPDASALRLIPSGGLAGLSESMPTTALTQEELLKQPVYIPFRAIKDPRDIKMLDPACGSMHFGLYAFDLFERIYEEAWDMQASSQWRVTPGVTTDYGPLTTDYPTKAAFLRDYPRLIIEHNIHGIDIDPRAVQIAGLSLWLRAQKSWQAQGVKPQARPQIRRSNIACAEPMPGEAAFLEEFIAQHLSGDPERQFLAGLVRKVFDSMKLAGEAGSLLKIEEEIADEVAKAKRQWLERPALKQRMLFAAAPKLEQKEVDLTRGITDASFWDDAEKLLYDALRAYSEQAEQSGGYQRRLFADDAARGFAFIDLCRKRYDVALMNPPFGDTTPRLAVQLVKQFPDASLDQAACFVARATEILTVAGLIGAITARGLYFLSSFERLRRNLLLSGCSLRNFVDLGSGVLDAFVDTALVVIERVPSDRREAVCSELKGVTEKGASLEATVTLQNASSRHVVLCSHKHFLSLPTAAFSFQTSARIATLLSHENSLEHAGIETCVGLQTDDDRRFLRLVWEIDPAQIGRNRSWVFLAKGGEYSKFWDDIHLLIDWSRGGAAVKAFVASLFGSASKHVQNERNYFRPGLTYPFRTAKGFNVRCLPKDCIFTLQGMAIFVPDDRSDRLEFLLGLLNSHVTLHLLRMLTSSDAYQVGYVRRLPCRIEGQGAITRIRDATRMALTPRRVVDQYDETCRAFYAPLAVRPHQRGLGEAVPNPSLSATTSELIGKSIAIINETLCEAFALDEHDTTQVSESISEPTLILNLEQPRSISADLTAYLIGIVVGRWNVWVATGEHPALELSDPFAPLPACPPGMLQNEQGLPLTPEDEARLQAAGSWQYPIEIPWNGLLVDDPGHPLDIEARVQQVLKIIWPDRCEAIEHEACEMLGVKTLRDYFRKPALFFADHLKRYSKSRRQAPIYWPLATASGSYTLWVYYHRLTDQTLYTAVNDFVEPKLKQVATDAARLRQKTGRTSADEKELEQLTDLEQELKDFRDELLRLAQFWKPNLNDGVQITAAPLWKLFRLSKWQKTLKQTWQELEAGDYDWAHLAYSIWPDRVTEKCKTDKSLAIAHNLEHLYIELPKPAKKRATKKKKVEEETEDEEADV